MKKCPFCAEEIQDEAIKCKHCNEFLDGSGRTPVAKDKMPWCFRTHIIAIAFCCVGPLALPLVWWRPRTSMAWKVALTILALVLTWAMYRVMATSLATIKEYYDLMEGY